jgi:hypothetical protein
MLKGVCVVVLAASVSLAEVVASDRLAVAAVSVNLVAVSVSLVAAREAPAVRVAAVALTQNGHLPSSLPRLVARSSTSPRWTPT